MTSWLSEVRLTGVATDFLAAFGRTVRQYRQERGLTQAELASRLNLARTSITNLEKGHQSPPLAMLPEIAAALGVDSVRLVENAINADGGCATDNLAQAVSDKDLRQWAGQVIGDTLSSQSPVGHARLISGRRRR